MQVSLFAISLPPLGHRHSLLLPLSSVSPSRFSALPLSGIIGIGIAGIAALSLLFHAADRLHWRQRREAVCLAGACARQLGVTEECGVCI